MPTIAYGQCTYIRIRNVDSITGQCIHSVNTGYAKRRHGGYESGEILRLDQDIHTFC